MFIMFGTAAVEARGGSGTTRSGGLKVCHHVIFITPCHRIAAAGHMHTWGQLHFGLFLTYQTCAQRYALSCPALSGGEMPHAQACVVYILRVAVIRQLPEPHQRKLLDRLVAVAAGGIAPPLVIAALEGMGALIEVLGEVHSDAAGAVEQVGRTLCFEAAGWVGAFLGGGNHAFHLSSHKSCVSLVMGRCTETRQGTVEQVGGAGGS